MVEFKLDWYYIYYTLDGFGMHASNAKTEGKENLLAHSTGNNILLYFECQLYFIGFTEKTYCICGEEGME